MKHSPVTQNGESEKPKISCYVNILMKYQVTHNSLATDSKRS